MMCHIHSWSQYIIILWPQGQFFRVFDMASSSACHRFFCPLTLSYHIWFTLVYHHRMMCHIHSWPLYDLVLWPQYQNYMCTMNLCLGKIFFFLWHGHTKFGIWVSPHETTYCVTFLTSIWPWPLIYMWMAVLFLVSFTKVFFVFIYILKVVLCTKGSTFYEPTS